MTHISVKQYFMMKFLEPGTPVVCRFLVSNLNSSHSIRIWDLMICVPNFLFLVYLIWRFKMSRERVRLLNTYAILRSFYIFIYLCAAVSMLRCFISVIMNVNTFSGDLLDRVRHTNLPILWLSIFSIFADILGCSTIFSLVYRNLCSSFWPLFWSSQCTPITTTHLDHHFDRGTSLLDVSGIIRDHHTGCVVLHQIQRLLPVWTWWNDFLVLYLFSFIFGLPDCRISSLDAMQWSSFVTKYSQSLNYIFDLIDFICSS